MSEHRETYKGREILVRTSTQANATASDRRVAAARTSEKGSSKPELLLDGKPVFVLQDSSGHFIASGMAYAPQPSLIELAKQLIDYAEKVK